MCLLWKKCSKITKNWWKFGRIKLGRKHRIFPSQRNWSAEIKKLPVKKYTKKSKFTETRGKQQQMQMKGLCHPEQWWPKQEPYKDTHPPTHSLALRHWHTCKQAQFAQEEHNTTQQTLAPRRCSSLVSAHCLRRACTSANTAREQGQAGSNAELQPINFRSPLNVDWLEEKIRKIL